MMAVLRLESLATIFSAVSLGVISGQLMVLQRALAPMTSWQSLIAVCKSLYTVALANISSAPVALEVASALGKILGDTKQRLNMLMFFIARATAPILPG